MSMSGIHRKSKKIAPAYLIGADPSDNMQKQISLSTSLLMRSVYLVFAFTVLQTGQYASAQEIPSERDKEIIDTITVTAERFNRTAQEIAASLTVFDLQSIEKSDLRSIQELDRYIPNVLLTSQGSPRFSVNSVRGISSTVRADYFSQTIGIYIDGVPVTAAEYSRALGDVQQIEVLRGPQGTLYGRNTPGGVINIFTRPTQSVFKGEASARIGNNGQRGASILAGGAIIEELVSGKVFVDYISSDGFTKYQSTNDTIDDVESITGSASLRFTPSDQTEITISASIENIKQGAYAFQAFNDYKRRSIDISPQNNEDRDIKSVTVNLEHDLAGATLQSITGLRNYEVKSNQDLAYNPLVKSFGGGASQSIEDGEQLSQEMRLTGITDNENFRWLVGAFYSADTVEYDYLFDLPAFGPPNLSSSVYDKKELAGFGEATLTLLSQLDLTLGVRAANDKHELINNVGANDSVDFTMVTPKLRAAYRFSKDYQLYALASRGSRTGGFNRFSSGDNYKPEYLWNYELGIKSQWFDNTLTLNAATFYIDWDEQQVVTLIDPSTARIANAGSSHNLGAELEVSWILNEAFNISGFAGINEGEYDVFINSKGQDLSGNNLVNTPDLSAGIALEYRFALSNWSMDGWVRPEVTYTGDHFFDAENRLLQSAYTLFNINFGLESESLSISLFIKNVFDKDYRAYAYTDNFSDYDLAVAAQNRTFGLNLKLEF